MTGTGPGGGSVGAGILGMAVLVIAFCAGAGSLVLGGILLTLFLPMLGQFATLCLPIAGPVAAFAGALPRDRWWRSGYAMGLAVVEVLVIDLQSGAKVGVDPAVVALVLIPPTIAGWMAGLAVARRWERRRLPA